MYEYPIQINLTRDQYNVLKDIIDGVDEELMSEVFHGMKEMVNNPIDLDL